MSKVNGWVLTDEQKEKFIPIIEKYIDTLDSTELDKDMPDELELTFQGIGPYQLGKLLEELGYTEDEDCDMETNGWQCDFWMYYTNSNKKNFAERLVISGTGITFELKLYSGVE